MTTYTPTKMVPINDLPAAAAPQYTAPADTPAQISIASFTNTDTVNRTVTVHIVPSAGAVASDNMLIKARSIAPGATITPIELSGVNLQPGDMIQAFASAAAVVNMVVNGYEISAS